jgi:hypothetical protein
MPKSSSEFAHSKDSQALRQIRVVFPFVNSDSTTDHNTTACGLFFTGSYTQPTLASLNASTDFSITVTVRDGLNGVPCEWLNGIVEFELQEDSVAGVAAITNAGANAVFVNGVANVTINPTGTWVQGETVYVRPTGSIWGHTVTAANYDLTSLTVTAPAA